MLARALLVQVLLAASALARPSAKERLADRAVRNGGILRSRPLHGTNATHEVYDENWAGAVLSSSAGTYKSVTSTFTVPTPKEPSGGTGWHSAAAWVGIDGATCQQAILQTGLEFNIDGSSVTYDAWYEWYPDYSYSFPGTISFSPGDSVAITVTATSTTSGTAVVTNNSKGQSVSQTITSSTPLCQQDAEWIVEDYGLDPIVPFANFGTVAFTGAQAKTSSGTVGPEGSGAWTVDIEQNGEAYTATSVTSSSVTVKYVGP